MSLLLLALLVPLTAQARPLSLEEALASASGNRDLLSQRHREDQARSDLRSSVAAYDPSFTASTEASGSENSGFVAGFPTESTSTSLDSSVGLNGTLPTGTTWGVGAQLSQSSTLTTTNLGSADPTEQTWNTWTGLVDLQVSQDVLAPFRRSADKVATRQAREALDRSRLQTDSTEQATVQAIAEAWWTWAAAWRTAELSEAAMAENQALLTETRARFDEGAVLGMEVARVEAEVFAAEQTLLESQAEVRRAADSLLLLIGEPPGTEISLSGSGAVAGGEVELEASLDRALDRNLDVRLARADLDAARQAERDARQSLLPELMASGSLGVASLADTSLDALNQLRTDPLPRWALGVDLTVPLGGRSARSGRDRAASEVAVAELALESVTESVRADVRAAVDAVQTRRRSVELADRRLDVARATVDGELARVEEGETRLDDLLAARNDVLEAASDLVDAEAARARAELDLLALEGRLGGSDDV